MDDNRTEDKHDFTSYVEAKAFATEHMREDRMPHVILQNEILGLWRVQHFALKRPKATLGWFHLEDLEVH
jgi:hypothetical protein